MSIETMAAALEFCARPDDPIERFIASLTDEEPVYARRNARESLQLHREFMHHVAASSVAKDAGDALVHAIWLRENAIEAVSRWCALRMAVVHFAMLDHRPFAVVVR